MSGLEKFIERVSIILKTPKEFFSAQKKEHSLAPVFIFLLYLLAIGTLLQTLSDIILQPIITPLLASVLKITLNQPSFTIESAIFYIIVSVLGMAAFLGPIYTALVSVILHVWIKLFRGKGKWRDTYKTYVYSLTPGFLFGWIPLLGIIAWAYGVYLLVLGVQKIHSLPKRRAILIIGIPALVIVILSAAGFISQIALLQQANQ